MKEGAVTKKASPATSIDASKDKDPLIGRQLGDYRLTAVLATGGMARIYKGTDYKLQRQAAVKVLAQEDADADKTLTKRFQREARAVAALEHDNIITIYQYGEQDGLYFLAMKLVKGKDLAQELKALKKSNRRMDIGRGLRIMEQVASALDFAHAAGVVHRDIKPSNILLTEDDKAVLTDFGLVLRSSVETTMGTAFGTPRYIAPEQAISSNKALPQSDIYSLAVILYEILTGDTPFSGESPMEIALSHISDAPPPPRSKEKSIPAAVERELLKALEKEPEKRHKSAIEFIRAIKQGYGIDAASASITNPTAPSMASRANFSLSDSLKTPIMNKARAGAQAARRQSRSPRLIIGMLMIVVVVLGAYLIMGNRTGSATADGAAPIALIYNDSFFTIYNGGDYTLNVQDLKFIRGVDGGGDDYAGDRVPRDELAEDTCFRIGLQGKEYNRPPQCGSLETGETLLDATLLFWRRETSGSGNVATFEVQYKGATVTRCDTVARGGDGECRFTWPEPPPTPEPET